MAFVMRSDTRPGHPPCSFKRRTAGLRVAGKIARSVFAPVNTVRPDACASSAARRATCWRDARFPIPCHARRGASTRDSERPVMATVVVLCALGRIVRLRLALNLLRIAGQHRVADLRREFAVVTARTILAVTRDSLRRRAARGSFGEAIIAALLAERLQSSC